MTQAQDSVLTDEARAMVGLESERVEVGVVHADAVRRFVQAIMDDDRIYWDEAYAKNTKYGGLVTPPLYPGATSRRKAGTPDPLDKLKEDRDWDGSGGPGGEGRLPTVPLPLKRLLNGGTQAEFYEYARPGDRIFAKRRYSDIYEKTGRTGLMVFIISEAEYTNQDGTLLAKIIGTTIMR